ncbi:MAG TPA: pseudouridine synthase [Candidatus Binatia bacterium]|jgi:23S rRNA pseudouridine2605 synthase
MERLQKILSRAGVASRREAEKWIQEGRVTLNGAVVTRLGTQADLAKDKIKVDGKLIARPALNYFLFHKPPGLITSMHDPEGRPHLGEWLESLGKKGRVFPVGRLDFNSSGLLLLTNDGELAQRLSHPRYGVRKVYRVKVHRRPTEEDLERLRKGIRLEDGWTAPAKARVVEVLKKKAWIEMDIGEGRYREVRRMFEALGYFVEKLVRIRMGPLRLGALAPGEYRPLSPQEIAALKKTVGM